MTPVVLVVDANSSVRTEVQQFLRVQGFEVCCHTSATELTDGNVPAGPACLVLNPHAPSGSASEPRKILSGSRRQLPVVFILRSGEVPEYVKAMMAGPFEFVTEPINPDELLAAVQRAVERDRMELERQDALETKKRLLDDLTARERQVFALVVAGKLNKQIAMQLGIAEHTVKIHRGRLMKKLGTNSLAELVVFSTQLQEISGEAS